MTTERIVGSLQKAIRSLVEAAAPRGPEVETHAEAEASRAAEVGAPALPATALDLADGPVPAGAGAEPWTGTALGLPPPAATFAAARAEATAVAAVLRAIAADFLAAAPDDAEPDGSDGPASDDDRVDTRVDVRSSGEVRETQMVKGVPRASHAVATDDRPRTPLPSRADEVRAGDREREAARAAADAEHAAAPSPVPTAPHDPQTAAHRPDASVPLDPRWVDALVAALASADPASASAGRILPSAILNAAMLPGWPPPRALEGRAIEGPKDADLATLRREAQIAALLEALGGEIGAAPPGDAPRRAQWRWLRRVALLLSGILVLVETLGAELAEMVGEDRERTESRGTVANRRGTARRIYLD